MTAAIRGAPPARTSTWKTVACPAETWLISVTLSPRASDGQRLSP